MSHLSIRITQEDEQNISFLQGIWGLGRSESARKALAVAAVLEEERVSMDKREILATSQFVGSCTEPLSSANYKQKIRAVLKKKHET